MHVAFSTTTYMALNYGHLAYRITTYSRLSVVVGLGDLRACFTLYGKTEPRGCAA